MKLASNNFAVKPSRSYSQSLTFSTPIANVA